VEAHSTALRI